MKERIFQTGFCAFQLKMNPLAAAKEYKTSERKGHKHVEQIDSMGTL